MALGLMCMWCPIFFSIMKYFTFFNFPKIMLLAILLASCSAIVAQNAADSTQKVIDLNETVISATRGSQARTQVAQQVQVIDKREIERLNAQTTADLLQSTGGVFVQRSQQGGGSPVLRGFEASRVLLVVDGVRMNNAIYRAGHLQNIITMDNNSLDRAEVLFGPASTVYGSDALGGAICFYTKNPTFAKEGQKMSTHGGAFFRVASANNERTGHIDLNLGGQRLGSYTSFTHSDFGDLRMGEKEGSAPFFGRRDVYVQRIDGKDVLVTNEDPYLQKFTGYSQHDILQKFVFQQNSRIKHILNIQYSNSSDVPRYDRLTDPGTSGGLASSEWYYGPQKRLMGAYTFQLDEAAWFNGGLRTTVSYQDIEESRHNRNFNAPNRTSRIENVDVWGFLAEGTHSWGSHSIQIGLDGQYNDVQSKAFRTNVNTGAVTPQSTRYPDGGSTMYNVALYTTHQWQKGEKWVFSEGLRAGYTALDAQFVSRQFFPFPYSEATQSTPVVSGSLGAVLNASSKFRLALNASSGFRVPNVDDLGKVFDSAPGNVIVPNPDLKPEKTFNLELNVLYRLSDRLRWENVIWGTAFVDAIVAAPFKFNGQDSILYNDKKSQVIANQNNRRARLYGFTSELEADICSFWAAYGSVSYTKGEILSSEATLPLDHIPPVYGRIGTRLHNHRAFAETYVLFNGKKPISQYNKGGEDNPQYAPADGMPAWWTLNIRTGLRFWKNYQLQVGVDNLLDVQYRTFASGINGPGRNIYATARFNF